VLNTQIHLLSLHDFNCINLLWSTPKLQVHFRWLLWFVSSSVEICKRISRSVDYFLLSWIVFLLICYLILFLRNTAWTSWVERVINNNHSHSRSVALIDATTDPTFHSWSMDCDGWIILVNLNMYKKSTPILEVESEQIHLECVCTNWAILDKQDSLEYFNLSCSVCLFNYCLLAALLWIICLITTCCSTALDYLLNQGFYSILGTSVQKGATVHIVVFGNSYSHVWIQ
jgi:hypothetical protein